MKKSEINQKKYINVDGNTATSLIAYYLSEVAEIYPITPSSAMAENCDAWAEEGKKNIFGNKLKIYEMQSEAGAVGALHGSLSTGALSTTFTASQGLLLMIPNMFKIAGELLPCVFHISARAIATHALSIFGDHSDVMSARTTGFNMICSGSVQEAHDLALVSHIASLNSSLPFLHFFDGFRTSHEIQKIEVIDEEKIKEIFPFEKVKEFKNRALNPEKPYQKGTAQNPDIFFQNREACNGAYDKVYENVVSAMNSVEKITGRSYKPFDYVGAKNAKYVIIMMGSGATCAEETIEFLNQTVPENEKLGLVKVRLYRPFNSSALLKVIPKTAEKIAVLDRTKESGSVGEPLFLDVVSSFASLKSQTKPEIFGGRYGLGSKEFTPACVKAVFDNLKNKKPKNNFTVGIVDDMTHLSLPVKNFEIPDKNTRSFKFFGLGSDGTVSANKNTIKIIGELTPFHTQGFFEYDSKKSGSITISHLRISKNPIKSTYVVTEPEFIAIHNYSFVARYNLIDNLAQNGTILLNTTLSQDELSAELPIHFVRTLKQKNANLYIIDGNKIANECGLGNKINVIMQSAFFEITQIIDSKKIEQNLKDAVVKTYGHKGEKVIQANFNAIEKGMKNFQKIDVSSLKGRDYSKSKQTTSEYFENYIQPINRLEGNKLPVSAFSPDGSVPTNTTKFEKRGIAEKCPKWKKENCIQCGLCVMACPHSALKSHLINRYFVENNQNLENKTANAFGVNDGKFKLCLSPLDCTGCGVCESVCPAKNKALEMVVATEILEEENKNLESFNNLPHLENPFPKNLPKGLQFEHSFFEYNYACPGCGETPYIKLATTLFGENMLIANATGCSSIYGGSAPACPYTKNQNGCGPAWANSLFEDNAEFGFGYKLGINSAKENLKANFENLLEYNVNLNDDLKQIINAWIENQNNFTYEQTSNLVLQLENYKNSLKNAKKYKNIKEILKTLQNILDNKSFMSKKSVWIIGGDGWAYDIGFGGLDHVLASNEDVNILVLDTEVYSNTGGQSSKSTPSGAFAKFAMGGKKTAKKDLGAIAMNYPNAYVASVSLGADMIQCINAFKEAEAHNGPSIILAYAPCINHGFNMSNSFLEMKRAVQAGYWFLYRNNPAKKPTFSLDSQKPTLSYEEFLLGETRYTATMKKYPDIAKQLFEEGKHMAERRYNLLKEKHDHQRIDV